MTVAEKAYDRVWQNLIMYEISGHFYIANFYQIQSDGPMHFFMTS